MAEHCALDNHLQRTDTGYDAAPRYDGFFVHEVADGIAERHYKRRSACTQINVAMFSRVTGSAVYSSTRTYARSVPRSQLSDQYL